IFMSLAGYSRLSGHGVIALATTLIETGSVPPAGPDTRITFKTFLGPVQARASVDQGRVRNVRFRNVPAFRLAHDMPIEIGGRQVDVDVAFGGNWYAVVRARDLGVTLERADATVIGRRGSEIFKSVSNALDLVHPQDPELSGLFGVVITGEPRSDDATMRNATVYRDGHIDRSPCPTEMAATMACLAPDDEQAVGDTFVAESLIDTMLTGRIVVGDQVDQYPSVTVEISGRGTVTGMHQFFIDPMEPGASEFVTLG